MPSFLISQESASYEIKTLRGDRTAAEWNYIADATHRRRRISQARFFLISQEILFVVTCCERNMEKAAESDHLAPRCIKKKDEHEEPGGESPDPADGPEYPVHCLPIRSVPIVRVLFVLMELPWEVTCKKKVIVRI